MPVVKKSSKLVRDTHDRSAKPADPMEVRGRLVLMTAAIACAADDASGSSYHLANVPANALVHEDTFFDVENWGFAQVVIGTETDTDALVDQTKATAAVVLPFAKGDAFHGKRWWEALGLAKDPGGDVAIWVHAEAAATAAGTILFHIAYVGAH
jgi:hypothetical protein